MVKADNILREAAIDAIMRACKALNWQIAIPDSIADHELVPGLVLGTEAFMAQYTTTEDPAPDATRKALDA